MRTKPHRQQRTLLAPPQLSVKGAACAPHKWTALVTHGQRLRVQPPARQSHPTVGFGSTSERAVLMPTSSRAATPHTCASADLLVKPSKATLGTKPATPRRVSTFELLRGLPTSKPADIDILVLDVAKEGADHAREIPEAFTTIYNDEPEIFSSTDDDAESDSEANEELPTTSFLLTSSRSEPDLTERSSDCAWDLTATWPPAQLDGDSESVSESTWGDASQAKRSDAASLGPLASALLAAPQMSTLWEQRGAVYQLMRMRRASKRADIAQKMEETVPESPCASAFTSLNSVATGSMTGSCRTMSSSMAGRAAPQTSAE